MDRAGAGLGPPPDDLYYADEMPGPGDDGRPHPRRCRTARAGPAGRLAVDDVTPLVLPGATAFVCGSTGFADTAADLLMDAGVPGEQIRIERFGASG